MERENDLVLQVAENGDGETGNLTITVSGACKPILEKARKKIAVPGKRSRMESLGSAATRIILDFGRKVEIAKRERSGSQGGSPGLNRDEPERENDGEADAAAK